MTGGDTAPAVVLWAPTLLFISPTVPPAIKVSVVPGLTSRAAILVCVNT